MGNLKQKIGLMLRNIGTKLSNNYGSPGSTYVMLHNNDLEPSGAMDLNNFMSVLGGQYKTAATQIDNIKTAGLWVVPGTYATGTPEDFEGVQLILKVIRVSEGDIVQTIYRTGGGGKMAQRTSGSVGIWNSWKVIL